MKYLACLMAIMLFSPVFAADEANSTKSLLYVKDSLPASYHPIVEIVGVETTLMTAGSWKTGAGRYAPGCREIILVTLRSSKIVNVNSLSLVVEYRNSAGFSQKTPVRDEDTSEEYLSTYPNPGNQLMSNQTYAASFQYPADITQNGRFAFNHILLELSGKKLQELWLYKQPGDIPNSGKEWAPISVYKNEKFNLKKINGKWSYA